MTYSSGAAKRIAADYLREQLQMEGVGTGLLSSIFKEEPPPLNSFLYDSSYLNHLRPTIPIADDSGYAFRLSDIQYDFLRNFEQIFQPGLYIAMVEEFGPAWAPLPMKNMFALEWAKGAGKDTCVRIGFTRIASLLSHMVSPQGYFNMASTDSIHMLNVAATAPQARKAFFDPMKKLFKSNKHLSEFFYGDDPAEGSNQIRLKNDIYIISGNSIAENQEGLNLIAGVADEISAFKVAEEFKAKGDGRDNKGAEGIVSFLRSSATSRFPQTYKVAQISFPRFQGDAIEKAVAEGAASIKKYGESSQWYISGPYATWEVKPGVTKDDFREHYDADPEKAATMYECKPPKSTNIFIRDESSIDAAFEEVKPNPIEVDYYWGRTPSEALEDVLGGREAKEGWQVKFTFHDDLRPVEGALYCLHGDMAIKADRAGVAMSHVKAWRREGDDERPIVKNDFVFTFESDLHEDPPREVQIRWYRQLIRELLDRGFPIEVVTFDQFQCLSGDTRIPLLDGTTQTMKELDGRENFWVYSIDSNGSVVPGLVKKAQWTGYRSDMVEVELDNGEVIKATQDHRFMMRDGSYREAGSLLEGDSLMPLYRRERQLSKTSRFYEQLWHPEPLEGRNRWQFTHSMVSNHFYGKLPKGWVTHHIDLTSTNNCPENLRQMTSSDHTNLHRALAGDTFKEKWADPEWAALHKTRISNALRSRQTGLRGRETNRYEHGYTLEAIEEAHRLLLNQGVVPTKGAMRDLLGIAQGTLYDRVREAGYKSWKDFRNQHEGISPDALKQRRHRARKADAPNNHKVVSITPCEPEMVYDLEVEEYHNFATAAGVFVHNSTDMIQTLNSQGIDAGLLSLDRNDKVYQTFKDLILDGRLEGYRETEGEDPLAVREIKRLRKVGRKVDHPPSGSKDAADALAGSVFNALQVGGEEDESELSITSPFEEPDEIGMALYGPYQDSGMGLFGTGEPPKENPFLNSGYFSGGHGYIRY